MPKREMHFGEAQLLNIPNLSKQNINFQRYNFDMMERNKKFFVSFPMYLSSSYKIGYELQKYKQVHLF